MLTERICREADKWIGVEAPKNSIAVSTRARYARNISGHLFAPHAAPEVLRRVVATVSDAVRRVESMGEYAALSMTDLNMTERNFLRESRLISPDMEKAIEGRGVHVSPQCQDSVLVNEEDHLRIQCMVPGFQIGRVMAQLGDIETLLADQLPFAFSQKLGYLTACPTNTGTGLRISVMLHLPGLARAGKIEELLQGIAPYGIAVRGFYGENSEFQGDFYQISNEITLGKSEEDIQALLQRVIEQILEREESLRAELFETQRTATEDSFWRAWAILSNARLMSSEEALKHLSWLRIGIDLGLVSGITHADLNRIVIEMQPAHLEIRHNDGGALDPGNRDELRARLLRDHLTGAGRH